MEPVKTLPDHYALTHSLDLSKNRSLVIALNILSLGLFIAFGLAFLQITVWLREVDGFSSIARFSFWDLLLLLLVYAVVITLHELIHGLFFWMITREKPKFGVKYLYAYATAPDWYLPRNPYLVVGLAPFLVITLAGVLFIPILPSGVLPFWLFALTANASGAIGDFLVVFWLLRQPASVLVKDVGDAFYVYSGE